MLSASGWLGRRSPEMQAEMAYRRQRQIESGEWQEKVRRNAQLGLPPPVGGGSPVKARFAGTQGRQLVDSSWDIPDLVEYDFSLLNLAGATTIIGALFGVFPGSNAGVIGSPDVLGDSLAVANGNRRAGTGKLPYGTLLSAWVYARASGGGVYTAAAGTTIQLQVISASATDTTTSVDNLTAAYAVNAGTTIWTQVALTVPASRQPSIGGTLITTAASFFYGDFMKSVLVTTGALNIQGNTLALALELA